MHTVEWNGQTSESTFHLFVNETQEPLDVSWGDEHYDTHYGVVPPGKNLFVGEWGQTVDYDTLYGVILPGKNLFVGKARRGFGVTPVVCDVVQLRATSMTIRTTG